MNFSNTGKGSIDGLEIVQIATDILGLTSFHVRNALHSAYRWFILAAFTVVHIMFGDVVFDSHLQSFFFKLELGWHFMSFFFVFLFQFIRRDAIRKCHRIALPSLRPLRKLVAHFLIFVSHFLILYMFYNALFYHALFYSVVLRLYIQVPELQFEYLIESVLRRIQTVNDELEDLAGDGEMAGYISLTVDVEKEKKILESHKKYLKLTEAAVYIASTYSCQILVMILQFIAEIIFILHYAFFDIIRKRGSNQISDFALKLYMVLTIFMKITIPCRSGEAYMEQCSRTNDVLCKVINANSGVSLEARSFVIQKILRPPSLSILGLFRLNYGFLYAIGCSIISSGLIIGMFYLNVLQKQGGQF